MTNASTNIINNKDYGSIINRTEEEITPSPILNSNTFLSGNRISFEFLNDADNGSSSIPTWKEHTMRDSTVIEAILNSVNYFVGIGVLSIPYALKSGWICVVNMIVLGIVFGITGELIGLCQQKLNCKTYPDIAEASFGFTGRIFVSIVYYVQLLFDLVLFFNLFVTSACQLFGGNQFIVLLCVTILMIVETHVFTTMRRASVLSLVGATTGLLLCVALFLSFCTEIGLRERGVAEIFSSTPVAKIPSSHWLAMLTALRKLSGVVSPLSGSSVLGTGLPMGHTVWLNPSIKTQIVSFGIISFSYMGHAVWPSVFHSMLSPTHYRTVVWVTIALITIWYTLVAAFGYYLYGDDVHDNVSLDIRLGKWFVALLNILICFTVGAKFALAAFPIVECFEDLLDSDYLKSVISGELQVPSTGYTGWGQSIQAQLLACIRLFKQLVKRIKTFFSGVISGILRHWLPPTPISPSAFRSISSKSGTGRTRGRSVRAQGTVTGECTPLMHSSGDIERASLATNSSVSTDGSIDSDFEALLAPIRSRQRRWQWKLFPIKDKEKRSLAQTNSGSSIDDGDCHGQGDFLNLQEEESEGKYVGEKSSTHGQYQNNVSNSNPDVRDHDYELGHVSMEPMSTGHQPSNSHDISFEREEKEAEEAEDRGSDMTNREKEQQSTMSHTRCLFIARTLLPVLVLLLYLALPSFLQLVTIIGGVFGTLICLVFPLLFYLFLCHDEMSILSTIVSWIGVVVGVGIAVAVSIASI